MKDGGRLLMAFGVVSFAAVATGALNCAKSGIPTALWLRNVAAWAVGGLAACGLAVAARPGAAPFALIAAPLGLGASLLAGGQEGVHRWLDLGPVHMNAAMLFLPVALVALASQGWQRRWPWVAAFATLALLVAQPDASQATAFGACLALRAGFAPWPRAVQAGVAALASLGAGAAWLRPDPLQPVPEVEGIVGLAWKAAPPIAGLCVALLAAVAAAPILTARDSQPGLRLAAGTLSLCFLLWAAMPIFGAFPVPFVGIGPSPILGASLGVGLLAVLLRRSEFAVDSTT